MGTDPPLPGPADHGPARLEEFSRWLVSIIAVMTGLFGAGKSMLGLAPSAGMKGLSLLPFVFFSMSIIGAIMVNFPLWYTYRDRVPASIKEAVTRITRVKWWFLLGAAVFFCAGIVSFVVLFV